MKIPKQDLSQLDRAKKILKQNPSIDFHSHLGYWESKNLTDIVGAFAYIGDDKLRQNINEMIEGNCKSVMLNLTSDNTIIDVTKPGFKKRDFIGDEAWEEYRRQRTLVDDLCQKFPIEIATNINDIEKIFQKNKLAVFLTTEGGHMVENDLSRLELLYEDKVYRFQPLHFVHSMLGDTQTESPLYGGLSPLGKESIKKANQLGMVIDLAHSTYETSKDIIKLTDGPVVLSHALMKYDSKKFGSYFENRIRFITRDHAFLVAETGGVIGTQVLQETYGGVKNLDAYIEATIKMVDTVGIDHIGWSTDNVNSGKPDWFRNYERFPYLCAKLLDAGFSDQDLIKFIGGNAIRVMKQRT